MNGKEIIKDWLKTHGYDGLALPSDVGECGCWIDENPDDFIPCESDPCFCIAGHKVVKDGMNWIIAEERK